MNIDWDFIHRQERKKASVPDTVGYVPSSESGVTIATGFDIGVRNQYDLDRVGLPALLKKKLQPYLGLRGHQAEQALKDNPLEISLTDAKDVDRLVHV